MTCIDFIILSFDLHRPASPIRRHCLLFSCTVHPFAPTQSYVDISPCEEHHLIAYTLSRYCTAESIRLTVRQIRASFTIVPTNSVNITKDAARNDPTIHEGRTVVIHYLFKDECMFRVTSSYEFPSEHSPTLPGLDSFSYLPRHP